ncbi:MAG: prepilin-type N-terminal cleavage/methylation domain-containing protein [Pseudomonadota bacterium]
MKKSSKFGFSLIELSLVILVIGILVTGTAKGSRIIKEAKLKSARALTQSSVVAAYPDLALWLETTSEKSFDYDQRTDNSAVITWYDINPQTISPLNVSQTLNIRKPLYIDGYTNGLPALKFDGTNDFLQRTNVMSSDLTKFANEITIFIVQKYNSTAMMSSAIYWEDVTGNRINLHTPWNNGVMYFDFGYSPTATDNRISYTLPATYYNKTNIITGVRRTGAVGKLRINGVQYGQSSSLTATLNPGSSILNIAKYVSLANSNVYYQNSYINEVIIYRVGLSDDEIAGVENYLSAKWGIRLRGL